MILKFDQPQFNHSGGGLGFGPDGLLYLGTGDGGGKGDASEGHSPQGNAQDLQKLNGKILRIDVDGTKPYAIPADNPFASGGAGRPEIYAWGFRNPWRLTWEPGGARRLLVSDVGYGRYEEVDSVVKAATSAGAFAKAGTASTSTSRFSRPTTVRRPARPASRSSIRSSSTATPRSESRSWAATSTAARWFRRWRDATSSRT